MRPDQTIVRTANPRCDWPHPCPSGQVPHRGQRDLWLQSRVLWALPTSTPQYYRPPIRHAARAHRAGWVFRAGVFQSLTERHLPRQWLPRAHLPGGIGRYRPQPSHRQRSYPRQSVHQSASMPFCAPPAVPENARRQSCVARPMTGIAQDRTLSHASSARQQRRRGLGVWL